MRFNMSLTEQAACAAGNVKCNIIKFYPANAAKDPDMVLEQALGVYEDLFIIGWDKQGEMDARSTLGLSREQLIYLFELFKHKLLNGDYDE
jgi:hypothetical protein